ncbi:MAG: septation ring formation regulator EzrA [Bacilli bacterium]|nr:septation ring formation regulator EzrA [Bacilli bacterium]MDD4809282.1 septation ring formation regulator EzrA [Bacilli bacterium]
MDGIGLISITIFFITVILVVVVLNLIQNMKNNKIKKRIDELEIEKNEIDSAPIMPELSKIEAFLKNEKLEVMYNEWQERLEIIKVSYIPKITEMILEAEYSLSQMDYKGTMYKIAKLELEIYKVRTTSEFLMDEIKEITTSEEKNRAIITKLKVTYRELFQKFSDARHEYGEIAKSISLQFENIAKRFEDFEKAMENNEYTEVTQIIKAIDEMLKHMDVVIEEIPAIVLLATSILPARIKEAEETYQKMVNSGYPLDYLNIEYNVSEANKKINDVMVRSRILNLEDSLFELKVLLDYFDSLFNDFEKERINRETYEEANEIFVKKFNKMNNLMTNIFSQIDDLKNVYNLSDEDMNLLVKIKEELKVLNDDHKTLIDHTGNNTFAYSKLTKEIEILVLKLANIEDRLDNSLDAISSMKEDEVRARQQLEEIKGLLKDSKAKIREYNLPIIPKVYFVELNEAQSAIMEIVKELDCKPITISVLNTRVDTARDLVLKLYTKTKEIMKTAMFAEMAIVYGNRYRSAIDGLDQSLVNSETLFFKGEYQKSLELTINTLNRVEPGIYNKLLKLYGNGKEIN